jgi:LacI family transcriptional regulator
MLTAEWLEPQISGKMRADAIICLNWVCTVLTLHALRALGREVGRDTLLLSFDDFDLADMLTPALSAVEQPSERLGAEAIRLLFERLNGATETSPRSVVLPTRLILRESCGCGQ